MTRPRTTAILLALAFLVGMRSPSAQAEGADPLIRAGGEHDRRLLLSLRTTFLYGTFSPGLGGQIQVAVGKPAWSTRRATGTLEAGVAVSYLAGAKLLYPWMTDAPQTRVSGADHHLRLQLTLGHTFHLGRQRRSSLGVHVFVGVDHLRSQWTQTYEREGLHGSGTFSHDTFVFGPELSYAYRLTRRVSLNLLLGGTPPVPGLPGTPGSLLYAGAGLTVLLR
jgi:hypothetical protein